MTSASSPLPSQALAIAILVSKKASPPQRLSLASSRTFAAAPKSPFAKSPCTYTAATIPWRLLSSSPAPSLRASQ
eukprot:CAMPEP_0182472772 /NCGR_PEP_ID=MMETSP1319-20130603/22837_1 /TAXON_ID=172717 /ORGANISM="Bolidomonas pacifica, Strain RCC208" /LENGTH=74 /DNA_ID=CAMNT_0024673509 /DNA_START=99 /DNA_END=320 /DNA_ORIENTATION=+